MRGDKKYLREAKPLYYDRDTDAGGVVSEVRWFGDKSRARARGEAVLAVCKSA